MTTWVTARGIALAVGVLTPAVWLWWADHVAGGWRTVLATAGLWWLAALGATWGVWLPAAVALLALWLAIPPRVPRRPAALEEPAEPVPSAPAGVAADGRLDPARLSLEEWRVLSRTPEGAAALAAAQEAARTAGAGPSPSAPPDASTGSGERAPAPEVEGVAPDDADEEGEDPDREEEGDHEDETPEGQDPPRDPPRVVGPASVPASGPAPPRTVWEAFALRDQEDGEDAGDDDAA
jgi:hypothetical protein